MCMIEKHRAMLPYLPHGQMSTYVIGEIWINSMSCTNDDNAESEIQY